jgi:hypothetical protein
VKGHTSVPSAGWFWRLQLKIHDDWLLAIPRRYPKIKTNMFVIESKD